MHHHLLTADGRAVKYETVARVVLEALDRPLFINTRHVSTRRDGECFRFLQVPIASIFLTLKVVGAFVP
jgi:hypothetical protein